MSLPRVIGITGYAGHGKDTVAGVLVRELGYSRVALADRMKELLLVLDPIVDGYADVNGTRLSDLVEEGGWEEAKQLPEVRRLLQVFGTEVGRQGLGEDVWIGALAKSTPGFYGNERKIVISDVRFVNEAQFIRRMHGEIWKVNRPSFDNGLGTTHASERELSAIGPDMMFDNAASKSQLQEAVYRYCKFRLALAQAQEDYRPALDKLAER